MWRQLASYKNNTAVHFAILFLFALVLNREGTWVASGNENVYLLYLVKAWHRGFLATDFTFQESTAGHPVFNILFGWPTLFLPLNIVGWIGRFMSWALLFIGLQRIGRHFRIPPWMVFMAILLWLIERQSFVGNEWMIGTFEAKCVSYICVLFAIDTILDGRIILPAILTGLAFTIHSAVGLWAGAAIGLAFLTMHAPRATLKFAAWALVFALPGILVCLPMVFGGHSITPEEAKFIVTIEFPFHLDPLAFGNDKIVVMYLMLIFNVFQYFSNRDDDKLKFLIRFDMVLCAFFTLGIFLRISSQFSLVQLFPCRVFAVMIMLLFFWHLAAAYAHRREHHPSPLLVALGIFTFLCLPSPVARLAGLARDQLPKWKIPHDDFLVAAEWVRNNTTPDTVVIAPPWRKDTFYQMQRPLIADWHAPRLNAITQWRERIESLVGDVSHMDVEENLAGEMDKRAQQYYAHLTEADIAGIRSKYGGDLLITPSIYKNYPLVYQTSAYQIYRLN